MILFGLISAALATALLLGREFRPVAFCLLAHAVANLVLEYNGCGWYDSPYISIVFALVPGVAIGACALKVAGVDDVAPMSVAFFAVAGLADFVAWKSEVYGQTLGVIWAIVALISLVALFVRRRALQLSAVPLVLAIGLVPESVAWVAYGLGTTGAYTFARLWTGLTLVLVVGLHMRLLQRRLAATHISNDGMMDLLVGIVPGGEVEAPR